MFDTRLDQEVAYSIIGAEDKLPNLKDLKMRDLFAMNAINGLLSFKSTLSEEGLAQMSYKIADAMIKARVKK